MERLYFAWPETPVDDKGGFTLDEPARRLAWTEANYRDVRNSWRPPGAQARAEIYYTSFFLEQYRRVAELGRARRTLAGASP